MKDTAAEPSPPSMYRRIVRNSAFLAGGTAAAALFTMLAVAVAARALSARDFGVLVLMQSSVLMMSALTAFSTQQPIIKLGSDAQAEKDKSRLGNIISMGIFVDVVASALAFGIAMILIELARSAIGLADRDVGSARILAACLLVTGYPTSNGIFRLYNRFGLLSLFQALAAAGLLAGYAALFAAKAELRDFVWAWAIYLAVNSMLQLCLGLKLVRRDGVRLRFPAKLFRTADGRTLLHYCWTTWGTSTTDTIRGNGDSLLVGAIVSVEAAGVYNVARQLAGIVRKFNIVFPSTVFPEVARLGSREDIAGAQKLNRRMIVAGTAAAIVGTVLAALLGHWVIRLLFGARFEAAYWPLVILTTAAIAQLVSMTPSMCVQIFRGPKLLLVQHILATIVFAGVAVALTFWFSILGTAIAQLIFSVILTALCNKAFRDFSLKRPAPSQIRTKSQRLREVNGS